MSIDTSSQSSHTGAPAVVNDGEFMLFGVRVRVDPMRKSVSLNDLSQYELPRQESPIPAGDGPAAGYASADDAVHHQPSGGSRERKRGVPWTEEEHKMFLLGLQRVGKGDWRGISRNFVKTRTPTQVASHAQKYFLRRSNLNRRRRRSSLFDITTESVNPVSMEEKVHQEHKVQPLLSPAQLPQAETSIISGPQVFSVNMQTNNSMENITFGYSGHINYHDSAEIVHQVPSKRRMIDLNLNQRLSEDPSALSLNLSLSLDRVKSSFNNGDSMISVA